jgi:hypothetical protein
MGMRDLLKRTFELWVKMRWLKEINKAVDQYKKARDKAQRKQYVVNALLKAYKEKYKEDFCSYGERRTDDAEN